MDVSKVLRLSVILLVFGACGPVIYTVSVEETPMIGSREAPHVLVVYSDFQCPFCKLAAKELKRFSEEHPDRAAIYFKHYPLRQHRFADRAARAAEAARRQGKFWEMHDLIFSHAGGLHDAVFGEFAADIGLDVTRFNMDMESESVADKIAADRSEAKALGLYGTPFFVLDGAPFDGRFSALLNRLQY